MPELPEVETTKNELAPYIVGRTITRVDLIWENIVREPSVAEFRERTAGKQITGLERRGKYLLFNLNDCDTLILHLKMTGSLWHTPPPEGLKFVRAIINLDNGTSVYFRDPRKFGRMWLVNEPDCVIGQLGPEPLQETFTAQAFSARLKRHHIPIKVAILDQGILAGVGNMYADEALFAAKIHPMRPADNLSAIEIKRLHTAICQVLAAGIGNKGASIQNYFLPDGSKGNAHNEFKVAHQRDAICSRCSTPIRYMKVRGRGTYFCPKCQV